MSEKYEIEFIDGPRKGQRLFVENAIGLNVWSHIDPYHPERSELIAHGPHVRVLDP